jgi:TonB-dependent receptor
MNTVKGGKRIASAWLKCGASAAALSAVAMAALAMPASAQDADAKPTADAGKGTEVVVVGVRRSLKSAQQIKRSADTIVDSITATDIGAFPDKSVAEALQRVAGVTVSRFAATTDTAHFSAEPTGVIVRGLSQVRSEFNGRDTFSANSSRGLSWGDVSPELMAGVDSYKNETASMIEGGIAGTINLRTRLPFDQKGQLFAISGDVAYNDLSKATTPDVSGIYSNRWDTSIGEFGVMLNAAYSAVKTRSEGEQLSRDGVFAPGVFDTGYTYLPTRDTLRDNVYDRKRHGIAAAAQWQNHDHTLIATLQYNDTNYEQTFNEKFLAAQFFGTWQQSVSSVFDNAFPERVLPATGTGAFTFDDQGIFQSGTMSGPFVNSTADGIGTDNTGAVLIHQCADWSGNSTSQEATQATCGRLATPLNTGTRFQDNSESTRDTSFNLKWDATDRLHMNFDMQFVQSKVTNYDMEAALQTWANVALNMNGPDGHPTMTLSSPENIHFADGGDLTNPGDYHIDYLMDHIEDSKGHEMATRYDVEYDLGDGFLNSLMAGVRYADREQTIQWSTYNWSSVSDGVWANASTAPVYAADGKTVLTAGAAGNNDYGQLTNNYAITSSVYPQNMYGLYSFGTNLMGSTGLLNSNQFIFLNPSLVANQSALSAALGAPSLGWTDPNSPTGYQGWVPVCERITNLPGSCFTPAEYNHVSEKTLAGYLEVKFGGDNTTIWNGIRVSGNAGVRWVQTEDAVKGYVQFPNSAAIAGCKDPTVAGNAPADQQTGCLYQTGATNLVNAVAFANNAYTANNTDTTHINFLPSFNIKFDLNENWLVRFAASKAMSRPDMGYLKSYVSIGTPTWDPTCNSASNCIKNNSGTTTDLVPQITATGGNPLLKPMTADQFDMSVENYFGSVGSFSFDLFYKKFYDYIQLGQQHVQFTNNGVTEDVILQMPLNEDGASVKGFEVAYQRFFDFLPGFWSGFGVQANYTHLHNTGVSNSTLNSTNAGTPIPQNSSNGSSTYDSINPHSLEGLSDDSYNLIGMYEKGSWALRLAYNWRSKYLLSALDCCVGLPIWQKAQGMLDGSIRYKVNDNVEVSLEGSNLLNTETVLMQQVSGDFGNGNVRPVVLAPDAWFKNDRRIQVGVRFKY